MNVLSVFDNISTGMMALHKANISVSNYYSCEPDKFANELSTLLYPDIKRLDNLKDWMFWDIDFSNLDFVFVNLPRPDKVADLKKSHIRNKVNLTVIIYQMLVKIRKVNPDCVVIISTKLIKSDELYRLDDLFNTYHTIINSNLVSAQNKIRPYWVSHGDIDEPDDLGITCCDILNTDNEETNSYRISEQAWVTAQARKERNKAKGSSFGFNIVNKDTEKTALIPLSYFKDGKDCFVDCGTDTPRLLTIKELCLLQTIPEETANIIALSHLSRSRLYKLLTETWTVSLLTHLIQTSSI